MAIRPRNCVFVSGYARDDGEGNEGPCIASYHLTGALYAPLLQILVVPEWGEGEDDYWAIIDIARNDDYLYVLVGSGDTLHMTNTPLTIYQRQNIRLYAVDVSDPANMVVQPGYFNLSATVEPYVIARPSYQSGFFGVTQMQIADDILGLGIIQGYYDNDDKCVDWFFFDLRRSAWPVDLATGLTSRDASQAVYWETSISKSPCGWAMAARADSNDVNIVRAEAYVSYAIYMRVMANVLRRGPEALIYGGGWRLVADNPAGTAITVAADRAAAMNETEWRVAHIETPTGNPTSIEVYPDPLGFGYTFDYPYQLAHTCAIAYTSGDDTLIWASTGYRMFGWSLEAEAVVYDRAWDFNERFTDVDVAGNQYVAAKINSDMGAMPTGYPHWSAWELWDSSSIAARPANFKGSMKGIAHWSSGGSYDIRMFGYGIVAGVPTRGGRRVDTYTDPTGIEWTVLLKDSSIIVVRPDTSSTYASPVTVDDTGAYDDVSITGNGTVLTIEARSADDDGLWRWRSDRYGLADTWTGPTEVPTT